MVFADNKPSKPVQPPKVDVSVAIRVYNSEKTLALILEKLKSQVNTENISWEIVVVDNNSTDTTQQIAQDYQASWDKSYPLKYFLETKQGAAFARRRAISEAAGEIISFLDDDNFPSESWVSEIYTFGQSHPQAGVFGSRIRGDFEVPPPKDFRKIQGFLAIKEYGETPRLFNADLLDLPAGAGMAVRKAVWLDNIPDQLQLKGPVGQSLASKGEDFESMVHISRSGWEIWYNPAMRIDHRIPACRLERDYLLRLVRASGLNVCTLRLVKAQGWQKPMIVARLVLGSSRRIIKQFFKHRGRFENDVVASCEMAFFVNSLMSPLNHLRNNLGNNQNKS